MLVNASGDIYAMRATIPTVHYRSHPIASTPLADCDCTSHLFSFNFRTLFTIYYVKRD